MLGSQTVRKIISLGLGFDYAKTSLDFCFSKKLKIKELQ